MTEPRPFGSFWQMRLSTGLVLMVVMGGLIGVDVREHGWPLRCWPFIEFKYGGLDFFIDLAVHVVILFIVFVATQIWMEAAEGN
jgi:hypothetical protein